MIFPRGGFKESSQVRDEEKNRRTGHIQRNKFACCEPGLENLRDRTAAEERNGITK